MLGLLLMIKLVIGKRTKRESLNENFPSFYLKKKMINKLFIVILQYRN